MEMYRIVGHDWVEHDEVAWCAAFVGCCLEKAGIVSTRKLNARSYLTWGEKVAGIEQAREGDVVVFTRGAKSDLGHVAFFLKQLGALAVDELYGIAGARLDLSRIPGDGVARAGSGGGDVTRAFIGASYQLNEHYNLDFYVFTLQSPMMRQGDKWVPRFPIGSITDSASNNTSLIVSRGAAY